MIDGNIDMNKNIAIKLFQMNQLHEKVRYFDSCYTNTIAKIRDAVNGQKIWVCVDETIDSVRHNVSLLVF